METRRILLPFLLLLLLLAPAAADQIVLNGGSRIEGVVLERSEKSLRLLLPKGDEIVLAAEDVKEVVAAEDAPAAGKYLRFRDPDDESGGLEVAVTYLLHPEGGPRVDLVGAVHVADPAFFREVQRILEAADLVLYEGIKPKDMTEEEFQNFCKARMAGYKRPREIEFRESLPTSMVGKVLRRVLREEELEERKKG